MRRLTHSLLLVFVFTIPWEYSLDLGAPLGNIARIAGLLLLAAAIPAALEAGGIRRLVLFHWLVLILYLWLCCSIFWTADVSVTVEKLRGYFQEMMIVWLIWEFVEDQRSLRAVLRAWLAGSWVLAILTVVNFLSTLYLAATQVRFVPVNQDPNDVARFLALGFPVAALLLQAERNRLVRLIALGYFIVGLAAVLLTGSRGGLVAVFVALAGCAVLLMHSAPRQVLKVALFLPFIAAILWFTVPLQTYERMATLLSQLQGGDLNQRTGIWAFGWQAFAQAPLIGHGVGTFVLAAGLAFIDTAHNTGLSILVEDGLVGFALALAIVVAAFGMAFRATGAQRLVFLTLLATWAVSAQVGTVAESRTTWLMFGVIAVAARLDTQNVPWRVSSDSVQDSEFSTSQPRVPRAFVAGP